MPQGVLYELPLRYKSARQPQEKLRIAREAASRVADGWAIGLTGGTTTTEVARALVERPRADDRHERAEHRLRARRAPEPEARGDGRRGARPVLRAGRPDRGGEPRGAEPRHDVPRGRRDLAAGGVDDASRDRGSHQPRAGRPGRPGDGRGRQLEDRQGRLRPDLRADRRRRADHRRRTPMPTRSPRSRMPACA